MCLFNSFRGNNFGARPSRSGRDFRALLTLVLLACVGLSGCGSATTTTKTTGTGTAPSITSFAANPTSVTTGIGSTLNWTTSAATTISISPGMFSSTSASGSTTVHPSATTTYTLTAANATGSTTSAATVTVTAASAKPTITSFSGNPGSIYSGSSSTLSWATTGAASIAITPGTFTSTSASGSTLVSPTATTTYTLTATNTSGSTTSTATVTIASPGGPLTISTTTCPGGTQGSSYTGCTISATGGNPPYTFSVDTSGNYPPLPEGMVLDASTGAITSSLIGGQGSYSPQLVVTDSASNQANQVISFAINGNNAFLANVSVHIDLPPSRRRRLHEFARRHIPSGTDVQRLFVVDR